MAGWWAPTGSVQPIRCPKSGFRCHGTAEDNTNSPPGSLPIEVIQGRLLEWRNVTRNRCTLQLQLDLTVDEWEDQAPTIEATLRRLYGAPVDLQVQAGSFIVSATAVINASALSAFRTTVATDDFALLRSEIGFGASVLAPLEVEEFTVLVPLDVTCPPGYFCSAAKRTACPTGTWSNLTDQVDSSACTPCPLRSGTASTG